MELCNRNALGPSRGLRTQYPTDFCDSPADCDVGVLYEDVASVRVQRETKGLWKREEQHTEVRVQTSQTTV